ncbi:MAG TPA: RecX family transcriptional regulator [Thermomicrobiales bacterium]|nr:RecX family transcriptional regulator [Thermomicrobiales bacterium]
MSWRRGPSRDREAEPRPEGPRAGRISQITAQVHDRDRVSIFLDDVFAFGLAADLVLEEGLAPGMALDEAAVERLLAADEIRRATAAALNLLAYRPRSEGEITTRLRQRNFSPTAIAAAIVRLREWHYVDDADFANRWIENRQQHRPRSARMLAQELKAKGVDQEIVRESIAEAGLDEVADARAVAERQRMKYASLDEETQNRRLMAFLARRGYGFDVIRRALEVDETDPENEEE